MNAKIIREAMPRVPSLAHSSLGRPCSSKIKVGNHEWMSLVPLNAREAASINNDARAICAELNKP